jgi:hypothetical protein
MDKRYQVFISSTYADLKDERSKVIQTIMEMDCIPAGMEIFPALDEDQFNFIKKVIDDCDYYIVIIGGRYGSLSDDGISYTEKEFNYAIQKNIKVIALLHEHPEKIPIEKSDIKPELREKLENFRQKSSTGRLVKFWNKPEDLPGLVALSLSKTIKTYPAIGWVRANTIGNAEILSELNELRKENLRLKSDYEIVMDSKEKNSAIDKSELAGLGDKYKFHAKFLTGGLHEIEMTWGEIFNIIAPYLMEHPADSKVNSYLADFALRKQSLSGSHASINSDEFNTIKIHLEAINLVKVEYLKTNQVGMALFWKLTDEGIKTMKEMRSVKK